MIADEVEADARAYLGLWVGLGVGGVREALLLRYGRFMIVDRVGDMTPQQCFTNAMLHPDQPYTEGLVKAARVLWIAHAWNRDVDHTLGPDSDYLYFGLTIPQKIAHEVMRSRAWVRGEGVLGTLQFLPERRRQRLVNAIARANS